MKRLIGAAVIAIFLFFSAHLYAKTINSPRVSAEEAIVLAKEYVQKDNIDVSRYFIGSVEYFNLHNEYEQPFWRIEYWPLAGGYEKVAAGDQIIIFVYQDGTINRGYGK